MVRAKGIRGISISLALLAQLCQLRRPRLLVPDKITKRHITVDQHSNQQAMAMYGFDRAELHQLMQVLNLPEHVMLNVPKEKAFLYMLYRYHSPSQRQSLDTDLFGYDYSVLS